VWQYYRAITGHTASVPKFCDFLKKNNITLSGFSIYDLSCETIFFRSYTSQVLWDIYFSGEKIAECRRFQHRCVSKSALRRVLWAETVCPDGLSISWLWLWLDASLVERDFTRTAELSLETKAAQRRLRSKIEAKFHTFHFPCNSGEGWAKSRSEFFVTDQYRTSDILLTGTAARSVIED